MAKWKEIIPIIVLPECIDAHALVRAALGRAADILEDEGWLGHSMQRIRRLASDPAELAAIISAASQLNKAGDEINERSGVATVSEAESEEEDRG